MLYSKSASLFGVQIKIQKFPLILYCKSALWYGVKMKFLEISSMLYSKSASLFGGRNENSGNTFTTVHFNANLPYSLFGGTNRNSEIFIYHFTAYLSFVQDYGFFASELHCTLVRLGRFVEASKYLKTCFMSHIQFWTLEHLLVRMVRLGQVRWGYKRKGPNVFSVLTLNNSKSVDFFVRKNTFIIFHWNTWNLQTFLSQKNLKK